MQFIGCVKSAKSIPVLYRLEISFLTQRERMPGVLKSQSFSSWTISMWGTRMSQLPPHIIRSKRSMVTRYRKDHRLTLKDSRLHSLSCQRMKGIAHDTHSARKLPCETAASKIRRLLPRQLPPGLSLGRMKFESHPLLLPSISATPHLSIREEPYSRWSVSSAMP